MNQQDKQEVTQIIQQAASANRFQLTPIQRHTHNGIDSPPVFQPIITYVGIVGVGTSSGFVNATATGGFAGGETSLTLTVAWPYPSGQYLIDFDNGDQRTGNFAKSSTAVTWTGVLSGAATAALVVEGVQAVTVNLLPSGWTVRYDGVGEYAIIHNLGSVISGGNTTQSSPLYAVTATAAQSTNIFGIAVVETFDNEFSITWADGATAGTKADTGFEFILTLINNKKNTTPTYYGTFV